MSDPASALIDRIPLGSHKMADLYVHGDTLYGAHTRLQRINLNTKEIRTIGTEVDGVYPLAFVDFHRPLDGPPDGSLLGVGMPDQRLYAILPDKKQLGELTPAFAESFATFQLLPDHVPGFFPLAMVGSNNAKYLYFYDLNRLAVCIVDLDTRKMVGTIQLDDYSWDIVISPDDKFIYAAHTFANELSVIDLTTPWPTVRKVPVTNGPMGLALSADGKRLFVACCGDSGGGPGDLNHGTLKVFDRSTMQGVQIFTGKYSTRVVVNGAGTRAYVSNNHDGSVSVVDVSGTPALEATLTGLSNPGQMCFGPDEHRLYVTESTPEAIAILAV